MTNKEFQKLLADYPEDTPIKLLHKPTHDGEAIEFTDENIMETSEQAYVDTEADPETWDCEDGKIVYKGKKYLLINPIIV